MKRRVRRQTHPGLLPRFFRWLLSCGRAALRHPQSVLAGALLVAASWTFWSYARRAEAFRITRVFLPADSTLKLHESVMGMNLWQVDVRALAVELKSQQPWLKEVRVIRQVPNGLQVDVIPRVPVAQVHLDRWYPVDQEGFVLPQVSPAPVEDLVQIVGCERSSLKVGKLNENDRLLAALHTLRAIRHTPALASRHVTEINVADPQEIRFLIDLPAVPSGAGQTAGAIEVRCGSEAEVEAHVKRLQRVLNAVNQQSFVVRYIDVRFQEPVIGPRSS